MASYIRRRKFLATLLGGAAAAWPLAARGQQARMPVLGFLGSASEADYKTTTAAVRRGLSEAGYVEKQNLLIDYRWANFQYDRLPALAAELVKRPVDGGRRRPGQSQESERRRCQSLRGGRPQHRRRHRHRECQHRTGDKAGT